MKRTHSGSDLSHTSLFVKADATPYVYMAAQQNTSVSSPMPIRPASPEDPSIFRRDCLGGSAKQLHVSSASIFSFPDGFELVVADGFLSGSTVGFVRECLFSLPLGCISRAQIVPAGGANATLCSLLCGCCFGQRQRVLVLDLDAPQGWIQWEELPAARGIAGPVRLSLHVVDAEEHLDAMGLTLDGD